MDRAYRLGQTRNVEVFRLVTQGTVEEVCYMRQARETDSIVHRKRHTRMHERQAGRQRADRLALLSFAFPNSSTSSR